MSEPCRSPIVQPGHQQVDSMVAHDSISHDPSQIHCIEKQTKRSFDKNIEHMLPASVARQFFNDGLQIQKGVRSKLDHNRQDNYQDIVCGDPP